MCRERKYKADCNSRCINSYAPVKFIRCDNPENFPDCITHNPLIDEVNVRAHVCKTCAPQILPKPMNYAAEVTAHASSAYRQHGQDEVAMPPAYIRRWFPRKLSSAAPVEVEGDQPDVGDTQPEEEQTYIEEAQESLQPPSHLNVSPLDAPAPSSSSQRTGIVYMENGHKYPFTVYNSVPENCDWVEMVEGEHYLFETAPWMNDEMREEFRPHMEARKRIADWTDGIQKKTSSRGQQ